MSQQLVKKGANGKHVNVMPKSWIEAIKDKNTGQTLVEVLQGFNMYFLSYNGNISSTRCLVPTMLRKKGLWITYVKYDGNVHTEWYAANEIDDKSWGNSSNWRVGNNTLVGDITISANGNWVINGTETEFKAVGEKGNTPLIRVVNNRLQVSYDLGDTYIDVTNNPVYTKFRWLATTGDTQANNVGRIQASTDEGKTWTNMSNDFTNNLHIKKYIGVNETLPTSGIAEGTIYAKGPYYAEDDTLNDNPIYRLWVYAWKGNTLAWQDNGEFTSIAAGVVQETGGSETEVMSQKAVSEKLSELGLNQMKLVHSTGYINADNENKQFVFPNGLTYRISGNNPVYIPNGLTIPYDWEQANTTMYLLFFDYDNLTAGISRYYAQAADNPNNYPIIASFVCEGSTSSNNCQVIRFNMSTAPTMINGRLEHPTSIDLDNLDNSISFKSEINYSLIESSKGINSSGTIQSVALSEYKVAKLELKKGIYYITSPGSGSQQSMWKYSDSSYNTPEKQIIPSSGSSFSKFISIDSDGYYAVCWASNTEVLKITLITDYINGLINMSRKESVNKDTMFFNYLHDKTIESSKYINTKGEILSATYGYNTAKLQLNKGSYLLYTPQSWSGHTMWKYTDSTFTTPEKQIVGTLTEETNLVIDVESGYYAICWGDFEKQAKLLDLQPILLGVDKHMNNWDMIPFSNGFSKYDIVSSKYVDKGIIKSAASSDYKIAYIEVVEDNSYWLNRAQGSYYDILWKYTDSTYSTPEKLVIKGDSIFGDGTKRAIKGKVFLEKGYYVLAWLGDYNSCFLTKLDKLEEVYNCDLTKNTEFGIYNFNLFTSNGEWTESEKEVTNVSTGISSALNYDVKTYEQEYDMSVNIMPTNYESGVCQFALGKFYSDEVNSYVSVGYDGTSYYGSLIMNGEEKQRIDLSNLDCGINKVINIRISKRATDHIVYDVIFTDAHGKIISVTDIRAYSSNGAEGKLGGSWGQVSLYAEKGVAKFSNIRFGYPKNMNNLKLLVVGHSFIEASTLDTTNSGMQNSIANLIKEEIGEKDVCIFGQGGASASSVLPYIDRVTDWCKSAKYCIIFLGYNDNEQALMAVGKDMQTINEIVKNKGIKPIWLTITENRDSGQIKPNTNQFIKDNFDYIDIVPYSYNNDGSVDKSVFLDSVHPSAEGHRRIFNIIRSQRPEIFDI